MEKQIKSHKELIVWQRAMELVTLIYKLTDEFPNSEIYGLKSQMRRSAVSIPSNIAEGRRRGSRKDFRHFLLIAFGSGAELETQIEVSKKLELGNLQKIEKSELLLSEVMRMLNVMIGKLQATSYKLKAGS